MSRHRGRGPAGPRDDFSSERTLAAAEDEAVAELPEGAGEAPVRCICGSEEFLLQAYLHVVAGVPRPEPVELELLTCPECEREYEAIQGEGGRILRGDFVGFAESEDDAD
jgi:hypothetical protein